MGRLCRGRSEVTMEARALTGPQHVFPRPKTVETTRSFLLSLVALHQPRARCQLSIIYVDKSPVSTLSKFSAETPYDEDDFISTLEPVLFSLFFCSTGSPPPATFQGYHQMVPHILSLFFSPPRNVHTNRIIVYYRAHTHTPSPRKKMAPLTTQLSHI
ncbi:hypothetical protein FRC16_007664 [Serendipita sp. 398]|nr:hypothetical protein FRC16_007664 [Serendipita sp. 398]